MHNDFLEFVLDQLAGMTALRWRRMFGGVGIYQGDDFFAIVDDGRLYFRVDDATRPRYQESGMGAFRPRPDLAMESYYEVPVDVLEDDTRLREWAARAVAAQRERATRKTARTNRKRKTTR